MTGPVISTVIRDEPRPLFTLVSAVHGVERFLPDFLASLDAQLGAPTFEVVLVDDGSTDGSARLLAEWAGRTTLPVTVVRQENAGQGAARNLGLDLARGEWVSFPDPDDALAPDYLAQVAAVLAEHPDVDAATCRLLRWTDDPAVTSDTHPLRRTFAAQPEVRDLEESPSSFFMMAAASFVRRDRLGPEEAPLLRFDSRVRPNFEDGHLLGRLLLGSERPRAAFCSTAAYLYRQRDDGTSALDGSLADPDRWTTVLEHGYLDLLERAAAVGPVPAWLQHLVVYDLSWLTREPGRSVGEATPAVMAVAPTFHALVERICTHLDPDVVTAATRGLPRLTQALRSGWGPVPAADAPLVGALALPDERQGLVRLTVTLPVRADGRSSTEVVTVDGTEVEVPFATSRPLRVLGRVVAVERVMWVPLVAGLGLQVDGRPVPLEQGRRVRDLLDGREPASPAPVSGLSRLRGRLRDAVDGSDRFDGAWVLVDRVEAAGDNAERLFEHLRAARPDVNAWFVVGEGTASYERLRRAHGRRVVAFGSPRWRRLMQRAAHVISSHVTPEVVRPVEVVPAHAPVPWRTTFLQHGVTKDDISNWLGPKHLDLVVCTTPAERDAFLDDATPYALTRREVVLTGMPRLDRLRRLAGEVAATDRDLVLVCPTWRRWLTADATTAGGPRSAGTAFAGSEYAARWGELLGSDRLRDELDARGLRLGFLPHPNLDAAYDASGPWPSGPPGHVLRLSYAADDVQRLLARSRAVVTDYSSLAFDAAYVDRPVVHHQFDRDRIHAGAHIGSAGYFDYERDGFGPVAETLDEVVDALVAVLDGGAGGRPPAPYDARAAATFVDRDGRCCERVVAAIEAADRPVPMAPRGAPGEA